MAPLGIRMPRVRTREERARGIHLPRVEVLLTKELRRKLGELAAQRRVSLQLVMRSAISEYLTAHYVKAPERDRES
jgi:hypothetical protein